MPPDVPVDFILRWLLCWLVVDIDLGCVPDIELAPGAPALDPLIGAGVVGGCDMSGPLIEPGALGAVVMLPPPAVLPVVVPVVD